MTGRSFRVRPGRAVPSNWRMGISVPAAGGVAPCECDITGVTFVGGEISATVEADTTVVIVAAGHLCPDTVWSFDLDWSGETAPELEQQGAAAWSLVPSENGTLTITPSAVCGGANLSFPALTLSVGTCSASTTVDNGWIEFCITLTEACSFTGITAATLTFDGDEIELVVEDGCMSYASSQDPQPPAISGHSDGSYVGTLSIAHAGGTTDIPIDVEVQSG